MSYRLLSKIPLLNKAAIKKPLWSENKFIFVLFGLIVTILASAIKSVYQIYFIDLPDIYDLSRSQVSLLGALFGLFVGIFSPLTGWLCDKYGASTTILSGIIVAVIGFSGIYTFNTFPLLIVCFSVLLSYALTAMTFIPFGVLIDNVFTDNTKNATYTLLANGTAIGFIILSPLWVYLNGYIAWQPINGILSVTYLIILVPIGLYLYHQFPKPSNPAVSMDTRKTSLPQVSITSSSFKKLLLTHRFGLLAISFGGCGMVMAFIDVHLVALLNTVKVFQTFSTGEAFIATSLSMLGITELMGSLFVLVAIKRFNLYVVLGVLYLIRALTFWLMTLFFIDIIYLILLSLFGLTYMGTVVISSLLCLRWYGATIKGRMFGMLFLVHQIFVFLSVWLGGVSFDIAGNYQNYLYALVVMSLLSAIASFKLMSFD